MIDCLFFRQDGKEKKSSQPIKTKISIEKTNVLE